MEIRMTGRDFERLCTTSMEWGKQWAAHDGRFENVTEGARYDQPAGYGWGYVYWVGDQPVALILAASFLADRGDAYELLWDLEMEQYAVLTDYAYPTWQCVS